MPPAYRTKAADDDLRNIALQIGNESGRLQTADRIVDDLISCCERLAEFSGVSRMGTPAPKLGSDVRLFAHQRWVIVFRYLDEGVLVLRIADGSQDYMSWKLAPA